MSANGWSWRASPKMTGSTTSRSARAAMRLLLQHHGSSYLENETRASPMARVSGPALSFIPCRQAVNAPLRSASRDGVFDEAARSQSLLRRPLLLRRRSAAASSCSANGSFHPLRTLAACPLSTLIGARVIDHEREVSRNGWQTSAAEADRPVCRKQLLGKLQFCYRRRRSA